MIQTQAQKVIRIWRACMLFSQISASARLARGRTLPPRREAGRLAPVASRGPCGDYSDPCARPPGPYRKRHRTGHGSRAAGARQSRAPRYGATRALQGTRGIESIDFKSFGPVALVQSCFRRKAVSLAGDALATTEALAPGYTLRFALRRGLRPCPARRW